MVAETKPNQYHHPQCVSLLFAIAFAPTQVSVNKQIFHYLSCFSLSNCLHFGLQHMDPDQIQLMRNKYSKKLFIINWSFLMFYMLCLVYQLQQWNRKRNFCWHRLESSLLGLRMCTSQHCPHWTPAEICGAHGFNCQLQTSPSTTQKSYTKLSNFGHRL